MPTEKGEGHHQLRHHASELEANAASRADDPRGNGRGRLPDPFPKGEPGSSTTTNETAQQRAGLSSKQEDEVLPEGSGQTQRTRRARPSGSPTRLPGIATTSQPAQLLVGLRVPTRPTELDRQASLARAQMEEVEDEKVAKTSKTRPGVVLDRAARQLIQDIPPTFGGRAVGEK